MSRHRDIRNLDYDEEYDHALDDDVYGHSVEDHEYGISPSSEQYLYSQKKEVKYGFGAYFPDDANIKEEEEEGVEDYPFEQGKGNYRQLARRDSSNFERPRLSSEDEARLNSVLDEIRNVVGDQFSECELITITLEHDYDFESSLNALLNKRAGPSSSTTHSRLTQRSLESKGQTKSYKGQTPSKSERKVEVNVSDAQKPKAPVIVRTPAKTAVKGFDPKQNGVVNHSGQKETYGDSKQSKSAADDEDGAAIPQEEKEKEGLPSTPKPPARIRDKAIDIVQKYEDVRGETKNLLNLVVVGHVDAGKSTLMGHLLYLQGNVAQRTMHKYEHESKKLGKQSFMYAWVLDETEEERSRGITVDIAQRVFETPSRTVTLLDAPGHRDFIPNMITGAARADVAVLVVDASKGGFEAGFESGGQTREHAILVRSLGVSELVVAVNKLETMDWSEVRFEEISSSLMTFLKTAGFKPSDVTLVPCSGLTGDNLVAPSSVESLRSWYQGPSLIEAIDRLKVPDRGITKPVRLCISDLYKGQGSTMCVAGRLEMGYVQGGDRLLLMPATEMVQVKSVQAENCGESIGQAFAGDHVTIGVGGVDPQVLHVGDFLCDPQKPIPLATRVQARIVVFNIPVPIIKGSQFDFHYQSVTESCRVRKLVSLLHKSTGQLLKQRPRALTKHSSAIIELSFDRSLCLEVYKDCKELGRFMLRTNGVTAAAGVVILIVN